MAELDVNDVMLDPMFSTMFAVRRQGETVGEDGRTVIAPELFEGLRGVITWQDAKIVQREDGVIVPQAINVATPFSLRDASFGYQPDIILWQGEEYRVTSLKPWRHLGRGWTRASAEVTRMTNNPPAMGNTT
jgi:hypothetical protein